MKLISLNIEGKAHLDRVTHFLRDESPDVSCLQEIFKDDFDYFMKLGYTGVFLPMTLKDVGGIKIEIGIALYSRNKILQSNTFYYSNTLSSVPTFNKDNMLILNVRIRSFLLQQLTLRGPKMVHILV